MIIKSLNVDNWNQFQKVNIDFHPSLTVITGANGSGKSTLLRLLSRFLGWDIRETATPIYEENGTTYKIRRLIENSIPKSETSIYYNGEGIGTVVLENGEYVELVVPDSLNTQYDIFLYPHNLIKGINIPSHRIPYSYKTVSAMPVKAADRQESFTSFSNLIKERNSSKYYGGSDNPSSKMKSSIISLAVFGSGNEYVEKDEAAYTLLQGFIKMITFLLPPSLGFENISIRNGEVILITRTGEFLLDSISGGIGSILDLAWQIYMYDSDETPFVVLIDEAENHLHASMQRTLLPNLISCFPNVQFIITTHSPFMVNSVKNSAVYVLSYNENNSVISDQLDFENKAANASQILRDVLGVPITMPVWVEDSLNTILSDYQNKELTTESYTNLKTELAKMGLDDHLPQALSLLQGGKN